MANVTNTISLQDKMTPVLSQIIRSMDTTIKAMKSLNSEANKASQEKAFLKAENAVKAARTSLDGMVNSMKQANAAQNTLNNSIRGGTDAASSLWGKIKGIAAAYLGINAAKGIIQLSDSLTMNTARLNLMNDGLQTTQELEDKIYKSAMRSRGSFLETADIVAKLGLRAGNIFKSNEEVISFSETLNKMFVIAGASQQEIYSATLQLTQALGSGVLRGEEFRAVFEAAPNVIQAIADYMNLPIGKMRELANEGKLSAQLVKDAMFAASVSVEDQFKKIPYTWGQVWTIIKNYTINATRPILDVIGKITSSKQFAQFLNWLANAISTVARILESILPIIQGIYDFIANNFDWIEPLISGIGAALLTLGTILGTVAGFTKIVTAATWLWNAALNANPIMLVITLIAGLIVWLVRLWHTNDTFRINIIKAWGFISDGILNAVSFIKIMVVKAFQGMVNLAIAQINLLISAVNKIPGVDIPLLEKAKFGDRIEEEELNKYIKRTQNRAAENAALDAELEASKARKEEETLSTQLTGGEAVFGGFNGKMNIGTLDRIKEPITLGEDDIRFLKDVAMKDFDVRYQQVTPMLTISNMNVSETADVNAVAGALEKMVKEAQSADINMGISYGN